MSGLTAASLEGTRAWGAVVVVVVPTAVSVEVAVEEAVSL